MKDCNLLVGQQVKKIRKNYNMTQQAFADLVGLSRQSIVNIEKGKFALTVENIFNFSKRLGCHPKLFIPDVKIEKPRYRIMYTKTEILTHTIEPC